VRPESTCRVRWRAGTVVIWDNRFTHHFAIGDYGPAERALHRVVVDGERPIRATRARVARARPATTSITHTWRRPAWALSKRTRVPCGCQRGWKSQRQAVSRIAGALGSFSKPVRAWDAAS